MNKAKKRNEEIFKSKPQSGFKKFCSNLKNSKFTKAERIFLYSGVIILLLVVIFLPRIQVSYWNKDPYVCGNGYLVYDLKKNYPGELDCRRNCADRYGCDAGWKGEVKYLNESDSCVCSNGLIRHLSAPDSTVPKILGNFEIEGTTVSNPIKIE